MGQLYRGEWVLEDSCSLRYIIQLRGPWTEANIRDLSEPNTTREVKPSQWRLSIGLNDVWVDMIQATSILNTEFTNLVGKGSLKNEDLNEPTPLLAADDPYVCLTGVREHQNMQDHPAHRQRTKTAKSSSSAMTSDAIFSRQLSVLNTRCGLLSEFLLMAAKQHLASQHVDKRSEKLSVFEDCLESLIRISLVPYDIESLMNNMTEYSDEGYQEIEENEKVESSAPIHSKPEGGKEGREVDDYFKNLSDDEFNDEMDPLVYLDFNATEDVVKMENVDDHSSRHRTQRRNNHKIADVNNEQHDLASIEKERESGEDELHQRHVEMQPDDMDKPGISTKKNRRKKRRPDAKSTDRIRKEKRVEHPCKGCGKKLHSRAGLYRHCREAHPDEPNLWPPQPDDTKGLRLSHLHERTELGCGLPECGHEFPNFKGLAHHERKHAGAYICVLCGKPCMSSENLISHTLQEHKSKSQFVCDLCGFFNCSEANLKLHVMHAHKKDSQDFVCSECPFKTTNKNTFQTHLQGVHNNNLNKVLICEQCGKEFKTSRALASHKKIHIPAESFLYKCKYCPKRFSQVSLLNIHHRVHTGEKPFKCDHCPTSFGSRSSLIKHTMNMHTPQDQMPYKCDVCDKTFSKARRKVYFGHLKQHSGEKDDVCPVCEAAFSSRAYLANHFKKVHKRKLHEYEKLKEA